MKKVFQRVGVVLATVLVLLGVGATAASASTAIDRCPAGDRVCTYMLNYGGGAQYDYSYWLNHCYNIGAPWNDVIHSLYNQSDTHRVMFYADAGCANGSFLRVLYWPNTGDDAMGNSGYSSLMWVA
jgi:hypothetical protein